MNANQGMDAVAVALTTGKCSKHLYKNVQCSTRCEQLKFARGLKHKAGYALDASLSFQNLPTLESALGHQIVVYCAAFGNG